MLSGTCDNEAIAGYVVPTQNGQTECFGIFAHTSDQPLAHISAIIASWFALNAVRSVCSEQKVEGHLRFIFPFYIHILTAFRREHPSYR